MESNDLPAATETTLSIAASLEWTGIGSLDAFTVSIAAVELAIAALGGVSPVVADTGLASGSVVLALSGSLSEAGNEEDNEQTGNGGDTHLVVILLETSIEVIQKL